MRACKIEYDNGVSPCLLRVNKRRFVPRNRRFFMLDRCDRNLIDQTDTRLSTSAEFRITFIHCGNGNRIAATIFKQLTDICISGKRLAYRLHGCAVDKHASVEWIEPGADTNRFAFPGRRNGYFGAIYDYSWRAFQVSKTLFAPRSR